ncbi:hypothetical protein DRJ17_01825 [Candidatus Woesearchaeota archaeon]|nr:MAG: hypothetical protein DRJ17_01825 [Candidatus Woesearchaeota archaeon]
MVLKGSQIFKLKKFIRELAQHRGRHTELVSVYIPQGYDMNKIINHLQQEQGTATNIKSASTRKNVIDALERMIQHLRLFKKTPENGLAVFSGNVAAKEGQQDLRIWSIEPPVPLKQRLYRCDKEFVLEPLSEMCETKEVYGLVVLDRRDAMLALLKGKAIVPLVKTHSEVPGKFKAGGQCCHPDTLVLLRDAQIKIKDVKIGDKLITYDFKNNDSSISECLNIWKTRKDVQLKIKTDAGNIIVSEDHLFFVENNGATLEVPAKELKVGDFLLKFKNSVKEKREKINKINKIKIIKIMKEKGEFEMIDISVKNQNFIANGLVVHNSAARFARIREGSIKAHYKKIADLMKEQFLPMGDNLKGIIIGGPSTTTTDFIHKDYLTGDIKKKIIGVKDLSYTGEFGLQELLDRSKDLLSAEEVSGEKKIMGKFFDLLNTKEKQVAYGLADVKEMLEIGAVDTLLLSESVDDELIEELENKAKEMGSEVRIISVETREGVQLKEMGGIAAILRYEAER